MINRRTLLASTSSLGLGLLGIRCQTSSSVTTSEPNDFGLNRTGNKRSVIVIGAGISGLAAAQSLKRAGYHVVVLEARGRIGGRIWTKSDFLGYPIDLGASWIHGHIGNPLYKLTQDRNIRTVSTKDLEWPATFGATGVRLSDEQRSKLSADYKKLVKQEAYRQQSQLGDKTPDQSVGATMERTIQELQRAGTIDQNQAHSLRHFIVAGIESSYAADAEDLSLRYWDKGHWFDGDDMLVEGGYKKIIDILAEGLDIRLSHSVKEIRYKEGPAKIYTEDGGQFSADQVVVTLPLGVLKNRGIKFAPDLPSQKVEAIDRLGVGLFNKIYLGFDEAFWPKDPIWFEHMGTAHDAWPWFFNIHRFSEKPILMAFNVGSYARQLEGRSDEAITEEAMGILHRVAKKNGWKSRRPIATQVTRWGGDPFARGSYSYIPVGASLNDLDLVGAPVGKKLFFAGEATSSQDYMTAHAAYLSGLRVAKALVSSKN